MKGRGRRTKPKWQQDIAAERIEILFGLAEKEFGKHPERSDRYVELARKIGMRYNVSIPNSHKARYCGKCYSYLVPGKNSITRTNSRTKSVETRCKGCEHVSRHPYVKEKAACLSSK